MKLSPWRRSSSIAIVDPRRAAFNWQRARPAECIDVVGGIESYRVRRRVRKRLFDVLVIWVLAPLTLLLLAVVAFAVAVTMGGPILYVQDRVGLDGRVFRMWKFRTMDTNRPGGAVTRIQDDRVTPLGRSLRRSHLDELPQVWNVLRGDMSLVGPRPEQPSLARQYSLDSPEFDLRHRVLPGITGWAQVCCSYAGDLSETMVKLSHDLHYIEHQNTAFDVLILLKTVLVVVRSDGR